MPRSIEKTKLQLDFNVIMSFAQELRATPLAPGSFEPASNTIADPNLKGTVKLHFSQDLSHLDIELDICGDLSGDRTISMAHIHLDDASKTGPLTVVLYINDGTDDKGIVKIKKDKNFNLKVKITNSDIIPRSNDDYSTNTIASLYNAIKVNNLYIDAHGTGDYALGMLRGQIYTNC